MSCGTKNLNLDIVGGREASEEFDFPSICWYCEMKMNTEYREMYS